MRDRGGHVVLRATALFSLAVAIFGLAIMQPITSTTDIAYAASLNVRRQPTKGLLIDVGMLGSGNIPTLSDLRQARFTLVGTQVTGDGDWPKIGSWITSVHQEGLRAFVFITTYVTKDLQVTGAWTKKAASLGADVVILDEIISGSNADATAMWSIIEAGLAVNPNLQFIITEYDSYSLQVAYSWTSQYPSVRVANDEYDSKSRIDVNIQLGLNYRKRAYTWLVFNGVSQNFDCYLHLDDWMTYVKQRNTDVLFYWINGNPAWATQWPKAQSF